MKNVWCSFVRLHWKNFGWLIWWLDIKCNVHIFFESPFSHAWSSSGWQPGPRLMWIFHSKHGIHNNSSSNKIQFSYKCWMILWIFLCWANWKWLSWYFHTHCMCFKIIPKQQLNFKPSAAIVIVELWIPKTVWNCTADVWKMTSHRDGQVVNFDCENSNTHTQSSDKKWWRIENFNSLPDWICTTIGFPVTESNVNEKRCHCQIGRCASNR